MSKAFLFCVVALCASPAFAKIVKANEVQVPPLPAAKVDTTAPQAAAATVLPLPVAPAVKKAPSHHARPRLDAKRISDWRADYEEAKNLLVPDQKYLIQYEE